MKWGTRGVAVVEVCQWSWRRRRRRSCVKGVALYGRTAVCLPRPILSRLIASRLRSPLYYLTLSGRAHTRALQLARRTVRAAVRASGIASWPTPQVLTSEQQCPRAGWATSIGRTPAPGGQCITCENRNTHGLFTKAQKERQKERERERERDNVRAYVRAYVRMYVSTRVSARWVGTGARSRSRRAT